MIFCLFIKEYFYNNFILINVTWTQVFLATTSHNHCWIKFTKNRYRDVKVRFSKKWLTVSRLNRLETFFRKPSCDFFFLLVVILLLYYCRSTESVVLLIQLILPLRSHRGTSYFFFILLTKRTRLHNTQDRWTINVMNNAYVFADMRRTRGIYMLFHVIYTIAHKFRFNCIKKKLFSYWFTGVAFIKLLNMVHEIPHFQC